MALFPRIAYKLLLSLIMFALVSSEYSEHDSACSLLVTKFLLNKSIEIQNTFKNDRDSDPLGIINQIAKDSFEKCKTDIRNSQVRLVNENGPDAETLKIVEVKVQDYIGMKVEPNYDFVMSLKKMHTPKEENPRSEL